MMAEFLKLLVPFALIVGAMALMLRKNQTAYSKRAQEANEVQRDIARNLDRIATALEQRKP